jgi:hypothetical protein
MNIIDCPGDLQCHKNQALDQKIGCVCPLTTPLP